MLHLEANLWFLSLKCIYLPKSTQGLAEIFVPNTDGHFLCAQLISSLLIPGLSLFNQCHYTWTQ